MKHFEYTGTDISGKPRIGKIQAADQETAEKQLKKRSISNIFLRETEAPAPPMSAKKKGLLASGLLCLLTVSLVFVNNVLFGPPDMKERFASQDLAIENRDAELRFQDYDGVFFRISERTGTRKLTKSGLIELFKKTHQEQGGDQKLFRKTKVLEETWKGSDYYVKVEHENYVGSRKNLGVVKSTRLAFYIWKRHNFRWKIYAVVVSPPKWH